MIYRWDHRKAAANRRKHRVWFDEVLTIFRDPLALTFPDPDHSADERRFITIGLSARRRIFFVAHADGGADQIRIISARLTTRAETHAYQEAQD